MELRVLKYFVTVAEEENMTKAAEVLYTSQSNLSRQLSELESTVGKKLFERGSRKITLTEEGMFLRKRAKEIIELTERTEDDLKNFNEIISGTVHIGAIETQAMKIIADSIISLKESNPQITYDIFSGSIAEITDGLNKGLFDFGLLATPVDMQKYDYIKLPQNDVFGLLMRKDCPLASLSVIRPEDIGDLPVWVAHQQFESNVLSGWLGRDVQSLNIVSAFNLITTPSMMIEQGFGMAFTFDNLVRIPENGSLCFRPLEPRVEAELYLVWKKFQIFTKPAELFLESVQKSFTPLSPSRPET